MVESAAAAPIAAAKPPAAAATTAKPPTVPSTAAPPPLPAAAGGAAPPIAVGRSAHMPPSPDSSSLPAVVDGIDDSARVPGEHAWAALGTLTSRVTHAVRTSVSEAARAVSAATAPRAPASAPRIVAIGGALVAHGDILDGPSGPGWLARLRARYAARAHIANYGADGYNAAVAARAVLRRALRDEAPVRAVFLAFGTHDACKIQDNAPHLPVDEFRIAIAKMAVAVLNARAMPILITPPALDTKPASDDNVASAEDVKKYAAACRQVAAELQLPCVDLHGVMEARAADGGVARFHTGQHLSAEGNRLLDELVVECFNSHMKNIAPDTLTEPFAPWSHIDLDSPAEPLDS